MKKLIRWVGSKLATKKKRVFLSSIILVFGLVIIGFGGLHRAIANADNELQSSAVLTASGKLPVAGKILTVNLSYDTNAAAPIKISGAQIMNGYAPKYVDQSTNYKIEILNNKNAILQSTNFDVPTLSLGFKGKTQVENKVDYAVTIPYIPGSIKAQIVSGNQVVSTYSLKGLTAQTNKPTFKALTSNKYFPKRSLSLGAVAPNNQIPGVLDIALVSSNYSSSQISNFYGKAIAAQQMITSKEPFHSYWLNGKINFYLVENYADVGCVVTQVSPEGGEIDCNQSKAIAAVNRAATPYDKIFIIHNSPLEAGKSYNILTDLNTYPGLLSMGTSAYNSRTANISSLIYAHEEGHTIGGLWDEYYYDTMNGPMDDLVHQNCSADPSGNVPVAWKGLVSKYDYYKGCYYQNRYRSSPCSMMENPESGPECQYYNPVSQRVIEARLERFAGKYENVRKPQVYSNVNSGSQVSGIASVPASATDDDGVSLVQLYIDNQLVNTNFASDSPQYPLSWDTTKWADGPHRLTTRAFDAADNIGQSDASIITINNAHDITPPTAPTNLRGDAVSTSQINLNWNASTDNVGVAYYRLYRNGNTVYTGSSLSFSDTGLHTGTTYTYAVYAYDIVGNRSASSNVAQIRTQGDITPPTAPTNLHGYAYPNPPPEIYLQWNCSTDNVGVSYYRLYRNGNTIWTGSQCTGVTDTGPLNQATTYTYTVYAYDAAGNRSASSNVLQVTTPTFADHTPPTVPPWISVACYPLSYMDVSWGASYDAGGIAYYIVWGRAGYLIVSTPWTDFHDESPYWYSGSSASYKVKAVDQAGNESAWTTETWGYC